MRPDQEAKFPLPYSLNFLTVTDCYLMIISVARKKIFNSILPVLKSISLREIIAFFHSFVSVRYLTIFILFCFALFFHFPLRVNSIFLKKKKRRRGAGGFNLPIKSLSTLLLVVNRFWSVEDVN